MYIMRIKQSVFVLGCVSNYILKYTTAEVQALEPEFNKSDFKAPMAGFGYGLPISRLVSEI
jgi:hypothetical protein